MKSSQIRHVMSACCAVVVLALTLASCNDGTESDPLLGPQAGVSKGKSTLAITPRTATIPVGRDTVRLKATVTDSRGLVVSNPKIQWSSSDAGIAVVEGDGLVRRVSSGQVRINAQFGAASDEATVLVESGSTGDVDSASRRLVIQPAADTIRTLGGTTRLTAQVYDGNGQPVSGVSYVWTSLNTTIASVDVNGAVTGLAAGSARIRARGADREDTATVVVLKPASTVSVSPKVDTVAVGSSKTLSATLRDSQGNVVSTSFAWKSLSTGVATVDATGKVSGVVAGNALIVATAAGLSDTATVSVKAAASTPAALTITPNADTIASVGQSVTLVAKVTDSKGGVLSGTTVTWKSLSASIATVDAAGKVTGLALGTANVTASVTGGVVDTAIVFVGVPAAPTPNYTKVTPDTATISAIGGTTQLTAQVIDTTGLPMSGIAFTWSTLDPSIASVTGTGLVTGLAIGTARIKVRAKDREDTATVVVKGVTPTPTSIAVTPRADTLGVGMSMTLSAAIKDSNGSTIPSLSVTWKSLGSSVASVDATGRVTALALGTAKIVASTGSLADTATINVQSAVTSPPQSGTTVDLVIVGYSGTGTVLVSSGIPLPAGYLWPTDTKKLTVYVNNKEQSLYVKPLEGRHPDGSLRSVLVQFRYTVSPGQKVPAKLVLGPAVSRTTTDITGSTPNNGYGNPLPEAAALPTSPAYLISTGMVGETLPASASFNSKWESNFTTVGDAKWSIVESEYGTSLLDGNKVTTYNYYDRALANFAWWARTGDPEFWRRAIMYELSYRDIYLRTYSYRVQPHNIQIEGLELHYLLTGNDESRNGVAKAADYYYSVWLPEIGNAQGTYTENRIQARTLDGLLTAARLGITARDYVGATRQALTKILGTQQADGSWRYPIICNTQYNYMTGLVLDAMIKYYTYFEKDARIVTTMKKSLDFMWKNQWIAASGAFKYASEDCPGLASPTPAPDLNLLIVNGFGWYTKVTGDATYRQMGDQVFNLGVANAWLGNTPAQGDKQFNQQYRSAYRYLFYRQ